MSPGRGYVSVSNQAPEFSRPAFLDPAVTPSNGRNSGEQGGAIAIKKIIIISLNIRKSFNILKENNLSTQFFCFYFYFFENKFILSPISFSNWFSYPSVTSISPEARYGITRMSLVI